jgi:WD40 repeat protein
LLNVATGQEQGRLEGHKYFVRSIAFAQDAGLMATGADDATVRLWDLATLKEKAAFPAQRLVSSVALTPDGKTLYSAGDNQAIRGWDVATGKELPPHQAGRGFMTAALSHDGKLLAAPGLDPFGRYGVTLWDTARRKQRNTLSFAVGQCSALAFSRDDKKLAAVGSNLDSWLTVWDVASGKKLHEWRFPREVHGFAFAPDGQHLATANANGTVYILRLH